MCEGLGGSLPYQNINPNKSFGLSHFLKREPKMHSLASKKAVFGRLSPSLSPPGNSKENRAQQLGVGDPGCKQTGEGPGPWVSMGTLETDTHPEGGIQGR